LLLLHLTNESKSSLPVSFDTPTSKSVDIDFQLDETFSELAESLNNLYSETVYEDILHRKSEHQLSAAYDSGINIFGRFKLEAIALGLTDLR
tara:strand:- start:63 stop:338 length:276 start_codon:yes stop_codon:yes gene_type:complete